MAIFNKSSTPERNETMARQDEVVPAPQPREGVISIIGPGMRVVGDCETDGTLRIEGKVEGTVRAAKAVVIGKDGTVEGDVITQDAIVGGRVNGKVVAESRLELQATCSIEGEIRARRIKLDEGGQVNGSVYVGEIKSTTPASHTAPAPKPVSSPTPPAPAAVTVGR
jgi:cytoskeletal protein CcmA (bactofilin family)